MPRSRQRFYIAGARARRTAPLERYGPPQRSSCGLVTRASSSLLQVCQSRSSTGSVRYLLAAHPVIHILAHLILGIAVAPLDLALELFAIAVDLVEVVVGVLTPLLLHLTAELLPAAFDTIPVHVKSPVLLLSHALFTEGCFQRLRGTAGRECFCLAVFATAWLAAVFSKPSQPCSRFGTNA